jgi:hypothetical protein
MGFDESLLYNLSLNLPVDLSASHIKGGKTYFMICTAVSEPRFL